MKYEFRGKTLKEAIRKGLKKLSLGSSQVEIVILDEGKKGLFRLEGGQQAVVMLTPKLMSEEPINYPALQNHIKQLLTEILKRIPFSLEKINTAMITGRIYVNIISESEIDIETLTAIENIVTEIVNNDRLTRVKMHLDCNFVVRKLEERLSEETVSIAMKVQETQKPYSFANPMGFFLRKVIHDAVRKVKGVTSVSQGDGDEKIVQILPKT